VGAWHQLTQFGLHASHVVRILGRLRQAAWPAQSLAVTSKGATIANFGKWVFLPPAQRPAASGTWEPRNCSMISVGGGSGAAHDEARSRQLEDGPRPKARDAAAPRWCCGSRNQEQAASSRSAQAHNRTCLACLNEHLAHHGVTCIGVQTPPEQSQCL
jgi:hypothetical protein